MKQGDTIQNTLTEEIYPGSIATEAMVASEEMTQRLIENKDTGTLDFVDGQVPISAYIRSNEIMAANGTIRYVTGSVLFSQLTTRIQIGYIDGGYCGYIAAGLILNYWHRRGYNVISSSYLGTTGFNGGSFTSYLYDNIGRPLGFSHDTLPWQIRDVLNRYCSNKGISATSGWWAAQLYAQSEINQSRPIILMGNFINPASGDAQRHAVVAYGYDTGSSGTYKVHYGHPGYSNITLQWSAIGGNVNLVFS